jgi:hypothetical protein
MELSPALVAQWIAHEAVANGILEKTPTGFYFQGDRNNFRIEITAIPVSTTLREREDYELGYD